ncbi:MAG: Alpha-D-glucose 1-phosphate phosphatase YihX [Chlamydiia bacterium]|nr:Alpha-D-glucose 1-phosphate phosphatase YihX [Chlamydiia bacterium]
MIKTLFFDLGNVLIDFDHNLMWKQAAEACDTSIAQLKDVIISNHLWTRYETGNIDKNALLEELEKLIEKPLNKEKFLHAASDIFFENKKMVDLLRRLHKMPFEIFLISNTCDIHFDHIKKKFPIFNLFNGLILSFEVSMRKPSIDIFSYALAKTASKPEECLFIDDLIEHVDAASSLGIKTHLFKNIESLKEDMQKMGIVL